MQSEGWHPDPLERYQYRFWNGTSWTNQVTNGGEVFSDDLSQGPSPQTGGLAQSVEPSHTPNPSTPHPAALQPRQPPPQSSAPQPYAPSAQPIPHQALRYHQPPYQAQAGPQMHITQQTVYVQARKSMAVAFLLTFFFGPLGMLYSTVPGALIMLFVSIFFAIFTLGLSILITWPICIIWGMAACSNS